MTEVELLDREHRGSEAPHHRPSGLHHRVLLQLEGHVFGQQVNIRGSNEIEYQGAKGGGTLAFRFEPTHPGMWISTNVLEGAR